MSLFLNRHERNKSCMGERGYEYQKAAGRLENAVKDKGGNVDIEGFYLPKEMRPLQNYGIFCSVFGTSPKNRTLDIRLEMDHLAKAVYESEMNILADTFRLAEYKTLLYFAGEDERKEQGEQGQTDGRTPDTRFEEPPEGGSGKKGRKPQSKTKIELNGDRREIRDAVTWRYKWIQAYKKDCYLFAQYKAEELLARQRPKGKTEQREFCEAFIKMAEALPETNRRLLDRMYETAWHVYFRFCLGVQPEHIPAPWYDTVNQADKEDSAVGETPGSSDDADMEYWG